MDRLISLKEIRRDALLNRMPTARRKMNPNSVRFGVKKPYGNQKHPQAQVIVGNELIERLHWKPKDKFNILFNDNYCIIERDNEGYWSLLKDGSSQNFAVVFSVMTGKYDSVQQTLKRRDVEFQVEGDSLLIIW